LYGGMAENMRAATDLSGLPTLLAVAFLFGMVHAFMPGHGKSVLVSYHLGRPSRLLDGVATGTLLALTHLGMAVLLVLVGVAVISRSLVAGGRAPAFELASAILIALIGCCLLIRAIWPPKHRDTRDGATLATVTGLVPCPLTTFILTYALARGRLAVGLAAVGGMLAGVIVTICSFAIGAIFMRQKCLALLVRTEEVRNRNGWWMELFGALGVLVL